MSSNLFQGLPPPSAPSPPPQQAEQPPPPPSSNPTTTKGSPPPPAPALKSALKRSKPPDSEPTQASAPKKSLKFKTVADTSETQVIDAMKKIASHINNVSKFSKASKLAIQLIQAGSVKPGNGNYFFAILEAAISSPTSCNDPSVRADYHALFSAAHDLSECFTQKQRKHLSLWTIRAVLANDLFTDDSFVFSKASGRIKETITNLPVATEEDDIEEAAALIDERETVEAENQTEQRESSNPVPESIVDEESDPFGLDALLPNTSKKDEKTKAKLDTALTASKVREEEEEEAKRFLKSEREALILCLEIAAKRYKIPWCQTVIDMIVKHAFDNVKRFTYKQRNAIEKLWTSIREQQTRRKQGKSVTGKLDVNAFEWLQQKYSTEKISIRHSVGGSTRRAEQWLG